MNTKLAGKMVQQRLRDLTSTVCSVCSVFGVHEPVVSKNISGVRWRCQRFFLGSLGMESNRLRYGMESPSTWNHHGILAFPKN